jgi:hypothetical protein
VQHVLDPLSFEQGQPLHEAASGRGQGARFAAHLQIPADSLVAVRLARSQ